MHRCKRRLGMFSVEKLRKAARSMYLIADEAVADDISGLLIGSADYIRNLKCCGNCKFYCTSECLNPHDVKPNIICDNWMFDESSLEERTIK
jgi:hypothetical protein